MRKFVLALFSLAVFCNVYSQEISRPIKEGTLTFSVGAFDFQTAQKIRNSSLSNVLGNNEWASLNEMSVGAGANFIKGISPFLDYSINGYLTSTKYPVRKTTGTEIPRNSGILFEADASLHLKLLDDSYIVVPYLSAGIGGSVWQGRYEAILPLGGGLQINMGSNNFFFSNFQYRVPVTQGANYHFVYTFGFGTALSK